MKGIKKAEKIAKRELKACFGEKGIYAGASQFNDYWARDSFFASLGALSVGEEDIVKKNLQLFLDNINRAGQVPIRVGKSTIGIALAYLKLKSKDAKRNPIYHIDKGKQLPKDQNSLFIIALHEYLKETKDKKFVKDNLHKIENIAAWNLMHTDKDLLIEEDNYCNWADSIKKKGKVLYTNVCYCHSLKCLSDIFKTLKKKEKRKKYNNLHKKVKDKINELFWNGEHYIDWFHRDKRYSYFSSDGNFLAVLWDIADKEKKKHIEEAAHIFDVEETPSECVHPNYPSNLVSLQTKLIGVKDYHNGLSWLWLGCINALAKYHAGMKKESKNMVKRIAELIIEHDGVYEVYNKQGNPVNRILYKSEQPFAWSSGLFLYAINQIS